MIPPEELHLSPLREDLKLNPGIKTKDGFPTWTIYDPASNKYYRVGWKEFEMLSRWNLQNPELLIKAVEAETTLIISLEDIKNVEEFLVNNNLIYHDPDESGQILYNKKVLSKPPLLKTLATKYLFFRIPLCHPDKFLDSTAFIFKPFINKKTLYFLFFLSFISFYLAIRQWDQFTTTFMYFFNLEGMFYYAVALTFSQVFHEFSHAYTANHYNCRVNTIGIAFIVLWPVLYTDATDSWKLTSRKKQLAINSAGIIAEVFLASAALLLWSFLDDGILRSVCFIIATVSWVMTLTVNLNPLMRFDGYFLLADFWDIDNLQGCSFDLGKWRIRESLFNFGIPAPFSFPAKTQFWLIVYAYSTWIYRFFLYLSIAVLVYYLFFKLLGIILFIVEIVLLIFMPIIKELKVYYSMKEGIKLKKINLISASVITSIILLLIIPWKNKTYIPAILRFSNETIIYAPQEALLQKVYVKERDFVEAGDVLMQLTSPKLELKLMTTSLELEKMQHTVRQDLQMLDRIGDEVSNEKELSELRSEYAALTDRKSRLTITAPFSGTIVQINDSLRPNEWLANNSFLFEIVDQNNNFIEAFIEEDNLSFIKPEKSAEFTSNDFNINVNATIERIDKTNVKVISEPYLASDFGGEIPVLLDDENQFVPVTSIYKIILKPDRDLRLSNVSTGVLKIKEDPRSIISRAWQAAAYIVIRESGL